MKTNLVSLLLMAAVMMGCSAKPPSTNPPMTKAEKCLQENVQGQACKGQAFPGKHEVGVVVGTNQKVTTCQTDPPAICPNSECDGETGACEGVTFSGYECVADFPEKAACLSDCDCEGSLICNKGFCGSAPINPDMGSSDCGAQGQACCTTGNACNSTSLACNGGTCQPMTMMCLAMSGQACCAGDICPGSLKCVAAGAGKVCYSCTGNGRMDQNGMLNNPPCGGTCGLNTCQNGQGASSSNDCASGNSNVVNGNRVCIP